MKHYLLYICVLLGMACSNPSNKSINPTLESPKAGTAGDSTENNPQNSSKKIDPIAFSNISALNIGQIEEFIARFNGTDPWELKSLQQGYSKRSLQLFSTIDSSLFFKDTSSVLEFIRYIERLQSAATISMDDSLWFGFITYLAYIENKTVSVSFTLKLLKTDNNTFQWAIIGARLEGLAMPDATARNVVIRPNAHNFEFSRLIDYLKDTSSLYGCTYSEFKLDHLSVILSLIYLEKMKISEVQNVEFVFLQIPGWFFRIKDFSRLSRNSGWLIFDLQKMNPKSKISYCQNKLGILNDDFISK